MPSSSLTPNRAVNTGQRPRTDWNGIPTESIAKAGEVLAEFHHIGVVYHRFTRTFFVKLGGYDGRSFFGRGSTLFGALKMAHQNAGR